jgi:2,3-bisphosphoglycerate-independent phosphoglycerate mutase
MKYVVVILDGAAGWPLEELGGQTTLQAARTPNLDALAQSGIVGLAKTVPEGSEPSSSAACTSILGYDPVADYVGRGAIEAASMGIGLGPADVALRCNLVSVANGRMASYAAGHITTEESRALVRELARELDDSVFHLYPGVAYRHILVVSGHPELLELEYTPPHDIPDREIAEHLPRGTGAELLLDFADRARPVLAASSVNATRIVEGKLPATDVWTFWPGVAPRGMVPFSERWGVRAAMTSGVDLLNGLAVLAGIDRLSIAGVSDGPDNDYVAQAQGGLAALEDHDLVVIHVESPDEAGHAGDVAQKLAGIEAIDRAVISRVMERPGDVRLLAMPDHPTPIALKTHVGEPVPFLLAGGGVAANGAASFDEVAAAATGLVLDPGHQVMGLLLA